MKNPNKEYFHNVYPKIWISQEQERLVNRTHYQYQEIMLNSIKGFPGCKFLELGCGSGDLLKRIIEKYPDMHLYGMDLGRESLLYARENISSEQNSGFIEGDITSLPIKSNTFDRILMSSVLWYVKYPDFVIREVVRILKPGGHFVFDVRNPFHITNILSAGSLVFKRNLLHQDLPYYSFYTPKSISVLLESLPVKFNIVGYFVLMPTRLPILGDSRGNWASYFPKLSFESGYGWGRWLSQKLLITGYKV